MKLFMKFQLDFMHVSILGLCCRFLQLQLGEFIPSNSTTILHTKECYTGWFNINIIWYLVINIIQHSGLYCHPQTAHRSEPIKCNQWD